MCLVIKVVQNVIEKLKRAQLLWDIYFLFWCCKMSCSTKRSSLLLSQQTPPLNISAPLTESEMLEQQTLEEAKTSVARSSSDDESKRYGKVYEGPMYVQEL